MTLDPNEVVTVYSGSLVDAQAYKQALADAEIESTMTGESLLANFGSAIPGSIELYVHQRDLERAKEAIRQYDAERAEGEDDESGDAEDVEE
jgi:Putative prokaryotic signal transducing protein